MPTNKKLSELLRELAINNPAYIQCDDGRRQQMVVMSVELIAEIEHLEKQVRELKSILSIIKDSLKSDYEYNTGLIDRMLAYSNTEFDGIHKTLDWRLGSRFQVVDSKGEHDPVYVVSPNGECFEFNHYADKTTDLARAYFVADTLNEAWDKLRSES